MPRPSRNVDAALLRAGRALYPATGIRGLSVRKVAERAGVNVAMFHYHFGSKEQFVRMLLAQMYDAMFEKLSLVAGGGDPVASLRAALLVLGRFAAQTLLNTEATIGSLRGRVHTVQADGRDIPVVVSYHPAYLLRSPSEKARSWQDLRLAATL